MVRPAAMRESSTPSARPLKTCDMNRPRLGILVPLFSYRNKRYTKGLRSRRHLAAGIANRRQCVNAACNRNDVHEIVLVFDLGWLLAAYHCEVGCAVVIFCAEVDLATHGVRTLVVDPVFEGFHHCCRIEGACTFDRISPK